MNTKLFNILIAIGFAFSILSCNSESKGIEIKDDVTTGTLYAMGTRSTMPNDEIPPVEIPPEEKPPYEPWVDPEPPQWEYQPPLEMVFTGDDIKSYNLATNEIKFSDEVSEKLINTVYRGITIYLNNEPLFEEELRTVYPYDSNSWWGYVVLSVRSDFDETLSKWINPKLHLFNSERADPDQGSVYEYDPVKRQRDWDAFIKYLGDVGKVVR